MHRVELAVRGGDHLLGGQIGAELEFEPFAVRRVADAHLAERPVDEVLLEKVRIAREPLAGGIERAHHALPHSRDLVGLGQHVALDERDEPLRHIDRRPGAQLRGVVEVRGRLIDEAGKVLEAAGDAIETLLERNRLVGEYAVERVREHLRVEHRIAPVHALLPEIEEDEFDVIGEASRVDRAVARKRVRIDGAQTVEIAAARADVRVDGLLAHVVEPVVIPMVSEHRGPCRIRFQVIGDELLLERGVRALVAVPPAAAGGENETRGENEGGVKTNFRSGHRASRNAVTLERFILYVSLTLL